MDRSFQNKMGFYTFFFVVLFLLVGGYVFTDYTIKDKGNKNNNDNNKVVDHRIDKNKDYLYYINEETISEGAEIFYKDVVINLDTQSVLTDTLEKENKIYKNNIKYISETELLSSELINYNNDNLYALTYRDYIDYKYDKYISLVIKDYNYSCFDLSTINNTKSYVIDTSTGELLTTDDILNKYNKTYEDVNNLVRKYLESKQQLVDEVEYIKIDETIDSLNYALYINEYGRLYLSFLVKTSKVLYNEVMEVI